MQISVQTLGISLTPSSLVTASVVASLKSVAGDLDAVVFDILGVLGVNLGEADVRVYGLRCGSSVLAG